MDTLLGNEVGLFLQHLYHGDHKNLAKGKGIALIWHHKLHTVAAVVLCITDRARI